MFRIIYSDNSIIDLKEIFDYIAFDNPFYATEVINKIYYSIEFLETFPFLGKERMDNIRELVEPQYKFRVFYKIENETIFIISIFRGKNI